MDTVKYRFEPRRGVVRQKELENVCGNIKFNSDEGPATTPNSDNEAEESEVDKDGTVDAGVVGGDESDWAPAKGAELWQSKRSRTEK